MISIFGKYWQTSALVWIGQREWFLFFFFGTPKIKINFTDFLCCLFAFFTFFFSSASYCFHLHNFERPYVLSPSGKWIQTKVHSIFISKGSKNSQMKNRKMNTRHNRLIWFLGKILSLFADSSFFHVKFDFLFHFW